MTDPLSDAAPGSTSTSNYADSSCFANDPRVVGPAKVLGLTINGSNASAISSSDGINLTFLSGAPIHPYNGMQRYALLWIEELGLWVAGGGSGGLGDCCIATSRNGREWTPAPSPFDGPGAEPNNYVAGLAWSTALRVVVAVGVSRINPLADPAGIITTGRVIACSSPDAHTWSVAIGDTGRTDQPGYTPMPLDLNAVVWAEALGLFVAGGTGGPAEDAFSPGGPFAYHAPTFVTSPDGHSWTPVTNPVVGSTDDAMGISDMVWAPEIGVLVAVGIDFNGQTTLTPPAFVVASSADATTWTARTTPIDTAYGPTAIAWSPTAARFVIPSPTTGGSYIVSSDGVAWTAVAWPFAGVNRITYVPSLGLFSIFGATTANGIAWSGTGGVGLGLAAGPAVETLRVHTSEFCESSGSFSPPTATGAAPEPPPTSSFKP